MSSYRVSRLDDRGSIATVIESPSGTTTFRTALVVTFGPISEMTARDKTQGPNAETFYCAVGEENML